MLRLLLLLLVSLVASAAQATQFDVLCYHDVRDDVRGNVDPDQFAVSTDTLVAHFAWLREHSYQPVSVDDLLAARDGRRKLPPRAVLLTFDDGYRSFYTRVYPLLKAFGYPAVLALVGSWLEVPDGGVVDYASEKLPRSRFLTFDEIREMQASGLVEIASHSFDLHHGIQGNPQGNQQPAAITLQFDPRTQRYETAAEYERRIREDLSRNSTFIEKLTGTRPRIMVWPYGAYSRIGTKIADDLGMRSNFTLTDGQGSSSSLNLVPRHLVEGNARLNDVIAILQNKPDRTPVRVAHVDLDYLYDTDQTQENRNLDILLERVKALRINTVFLQAFADPDGDGTASALYFPNQHLTVRKDLFNRVAWQLRTRANVSVYAWMPVLAFDLDGRPAATDMLVQSAGDRDHSYRRLSPFDPRARRIIKEIYEDLAGHADFAGILFHDDAVLGDKEDANPSALAVYEQQWQLPPSISAIHDNPESAARWARLKTQYLLEFTKELTDTVRRMRPEVKTARNLYARVVMEPESEAWFAQNLEDFARGYDYVALMAMPYMEGADEPGQWLRHLARRIPAPTLTKTVFELQSRDWRTMNDLPSTELRAQMQLLARAGVRNFGYYPDDFVTGHPDLSEIFPAISLSDYPHDPEGTPKDLSKLSSGIRVP